MCTCCVKVPKVALYGAAFGALVSWIANVVEAAELKCSEEDEDDGLCEIKKLERISAILASVIWIAAVGLIVSIPVHDRAKNNNSEGEDNQGSKNELEVA